MRSIHQYQSVAIDTDIYSADPHRIIQLLMQGFLDKLILAKSAISRNQVKEKSESIDKALKILGGLLGSLDMSVPGTLPENLNFLYRYMSRQLLEANLRNDSVILDQIHGIMRTLKEGWDEIPQSVKTEHAQNMRAQH